MHIKSKDRKLKMIGLIIFVVFMLLICHTAFTPHQLLPKGFRWGLYPVSIGGEDYPLVAGDLVIADKKAPLELGAMVVLGDGTRNLFGRILTAEEGIYTLRLWVDGQPTETDAAAPHRVTYHITGLGNAVLFLHTHRIAVWLSCLTLLLSWTISHLVTAKARRMKKIREEYIRLFDTYGQKFDTEEEY